MMLSGDLVLFWLAVVFCGGGMFCFIQFRFSLPLLFSALPSSLFFFGFFPTSV